MRVTLWRAADDDYIPDAAYDEDEAAVDALGGGEACRHGQWPHQKAMCAFCAAEAATKIFSGFFKA
jgi:hypothetical protein